MPKQRIVAIGIMRQRTSRPLPSRKGIAVAPWADPGARRSHRVHHAIERAARERDVETRPGCRWCDRSSPSAMLAADDQQPLPLRPRHGRDPSRTDWRS